MPLSRINVLECFSVTMPSIVLYAAGSMRHFFIFKWFLSIAIFQGLLHAHVGDHPSINDTVAAITMRMKSSFTEEQLK